MPDGARNLPANPMVTVDVNALLVQMSTECANQGITNNTQLSSVVLGLNDVQTAALMRRLLAVCVRVGPPVP